MTRLPTVRKAFVAMAALLLGAFLLVFGCMLRFEACASCVGGVVPWWGVIAAGLAWTCMALLLITGRTLSATALGAALTGGHLSIVVQFPTGACWVCIGTLLVEALLSTILFAARDAAPRGRIDRGTVLASAASLGVVLGVVSGSVFLDPGPPRIVQNVAAEAGANVRIFVVVRRNCAQCVEVERRLRDDMQARTGYMTIVVEEFSAEGRRLVEQAQLERFPAFIAVRQARIVASQGGGTMEKFLDTLRDRSHSSTQSEK